MTHGNLVRQCGAHIKANEDFHRPASNAHRDLLKGKTLKIEEFAFLRKLNTPMERHLCLSSSAIISLCVVRVAVHRFYGMNNAERQEVRDENSSRTIRAGPSNRRTRAPTVGNGESSRASHR